MAHIEYYDSDGVWYPSITTVLGETLPKPYLLPWAVKLAKKGKSYEEERDKAGEIGQKFHDALEAYVKGTAKASDLTAAERRACISLKTELAEAGLPVDLSKSGVTFTDEVEVLSELHHACKHSIRGVELPVSGTCDLILKPRSGGCIVIDFKTSNSVGESAWLQLAGYDTMHSQLYGSAGTAYGVFHISKKSGEGEFLWLSSAPALSILKDGFAGLLDQFHRYRSVSALITNQGLRSRKS